MAKAEKNIAGNTYLNRKIEIPGRRRLVRVCAPFPLPAPRFSYFMDPHVGVSVQRTGHLSPGGLMIKGAPRSHSKWTESRRRCVGRSSPRSSARSTFRMLRAAWGVWGGSEGQCVGLVGFLCGVGVARWGGCNVGNVSRSGLDGRRGGGGGPRGVGREEKNEKKKRVEEGSGARRWGKGGGKRASSLRMLGGRV